MPTCRRRRRPLRAVEPPASTLYNQIGAPLACPSLDFLIWLASCLLRTPPSAPAPKAPRRVRGSRQAGTKTRTALSSGRRPRATRSPSNPNLLVAANSRGLTSTGTSAGRPRSSVDVVSQTRRRQRRPLRAFITPAPPLRNQIGAP